MTPFAQVTCINIGDEKMKMASEKKRLDLGLQTCLFVPVRRFVYSESSFRP